MTPAPASKSTKSDATKPTAGQPAKEAPAKPYNALEDLYRNLLFLEKHVKENNKEKLPRVLRNNSRIRQQITKAQLTTAIEVALANSPSKAVLVKYASTLPADPVPEPQETSDAMDIDTDKKDDAKETKSTPEITGKAMDLPEAEIYLHLLVLAQLLHHKNNDMALELASSVVEKCGTLNRRTLDYLNARAYFYFSLCHQINGTQESIRSALLAAHRTACLRHDEIGQATLINLLLSNYLSKNLYDQAFKLVSKSSFPEAVSNGQFVRYLYYVGRIQAIQLDYTDAYTKLMQALRKSPQNTAGGFRCTVQKLAIIVQLLMGEVPERQIFNQESYKEALVPYFELTNAVRVGDLGEFNKTLEKHSQLFTEDKMHTLILRLRHNVIKTGLRKINVSYSRISFKDICTKLALGTPENAEFVCAKAISDGVIDAIIDHKNGWIQSKELMDVYGTNEPQLAFKKRIMFCLDVHNEAVKAMRYPPDAYRKELESAEERLEREKQEEELQKEIQGELDDEGL